MKPVIATVNNVVSMALAATLARNAKLSSDYIYTVDRLSDLDVSNSHVEAVDVQIDIDVANELASRGNTVVVYTRSLNTLMLNAPVKVAYFDSAMSMATVFASGRVDDYVLACATLAREPIVLMYADREYIEQKIFPMAIGFEASRDISAFIKTPEGLMRYVSKYPPYEKHKDVEIYEHDDIVAVVVMDDLGEWTTKTLEYVAYKQGLDHVIAVVRKPKAKYDLYVYTYWLAMHRGSYPYKLPRPGEVAIKTYESFTEAMKKAMDMYNSIKLKEPDAARLINERDVVNAIRSDFKKILKQIEEIKRGPQLFKLLQAAFSTDQNGCIYVELSKMAKKLELETQTIRDILKDYIIKTPSNHYYVRICP